MDEPGSDLTLAWEQVTRLIDLIPDGVLVVDAQGTIACVNGAMQALCGRPADQLVGAPLAQLLPPALRQRHEGHLRHHFAQPRARAMGRVPLLSLWHAEGRPVPVDISLGTLRRDATTLTLAVIHDMTAVQAMHERARYLAMHDELTGLYSRPMFGELLAQAAEQARRDRRPMAMLLIDLDDFKSVNDGHGHPVGDELLKAVAQRMRSVLRGSDALARLGGDEFAVLLREQADVADAVSVAQKLVDVVAGAWHWGHHEIHPGASIGIVVAPHDGTDAPTLMRHADLAMYRAKEAGRGTWAVFDAGMAEQMREKALLQGRLKRAIEGDALRLHYQPQLCARSGQVVGVEALLRWHDPDLGEVAPARFIAVAEHSGLILRLGDWVIDSACRQIAQWREQGLVLRVAVNVSVHQLRQPQFADRLQQALQRWQVPPRQFELEITETAAMTHREQARGLLQRLQAMGVQLALDDFGIGHSSLGHLREMPVTRLKMDRAFVRGVTLDAADAVMTRAIIGLARTLGKTVVAEGVETEAQRAFLQREGCDELQGWLFARDVPAGEVPALVRRLAGARA